MAARSLNYLLRGQSARNRLHELEGKRLSILFTDIPSEIRFTFQGKKLYASSSVDWDVRISGDVASFWLLATRKEDPDTLFFDRRLNIEGDTETGLYIKNMLDALEYNWPAHFADVLGHLKSAIGRNRMHH